MTVGAHHRVERGPGRGGWFPEGPETGDVPSLPPPGGFDGVAFVSTVGCGEMRAAAGFD